MPLSGQILKRESSALEENPSFSPWIPPVMSVSCTLGGRSAQLASLFRRLMRIGHSGALPEQDMFMRLTCVGNRVNN